jgi:hypothetical protein
MIGFSQGISKQQSEGLHIYRNDSFYKKLWSKSATMSGSMGGTGPEAGV